MSDATLGHGTRKARKQHRCCACWNMIEPGEEYSWCSLIWYGEFYSHKHHLGCDKAISEAVKASGRSCDPEEWACGGDPITFRQTDGTYKTRDW